MKRRIKIAGLLALVAMIVVVTPVFAIVYQATYTVSENGTASHDMLGVMQASNNQWMADNGFFNSTANDTRIETLGGSEKPHMVTEDTTLTAIPVPLSSQTNLYFTTGNSELTDFYIIPGYSANSSVGYISVTDNTSIELGDNFTITQTGWTQTTFTSGNYSDRNLIYKEDAFRTYGSGSGNITSAITITPETLRPDGAGDEENITTSTSGAGLHWQDVNDDPINDATKLQENAGYNRDLYQCDNTATDRRGTIEQVEIFARGHSAAVGNSYLKTAIKTGGTAYDGDEESMPNATWVNYSTVYINNPKTNNPWTWAEINAVQIGVSLKDDVQNAECSEVWIEVSYEIDVTATGVSSAHHIVTTEANGLFFGVGIDQTNSDSWVISDNLVLNAPLYHTGLSTSPFTTKDANEFTATVTGATWTADGWDFDGNDYITVPDDPAFNMVTELTALVWVKTDALATTRIILSKYGSAGNKREWAIDRESVAGDVAVYFGDPADGTLEGREVTNSAYIVDDTWVHIAFTYNVGTILIYINGGAVGTNTIGAIPATLYNGTADVVMGIDNDHSAGAGWKGLIGEVQSYDRALSPAEVLYNYNATRWKYDASDAFEEYELVGAGVPNNANDWTLLGRNSMPYCDNMTISVNGTQALWFDPTSIILGTNLPDRSVNTNNGTFHWGANPSGVSVALGSMVSGDQPAPGAGVVTPAQDILPEVEVSDWFLDPDVHGALLTHPLRPFVTIMSGTTTLTELQAWRWLGLAFILFVTVLTAVNVRGHQGITLIVAGLATGLMVAWTIYPMWALIFTIGCGIGGLIMERSPTL